jgi:prophage tail gpP-like protein
MAENLTLILNGVQISGWESVSVTRGIEACAPTFTVQLSERFRAADPATICRPGDPVAVVAPGKASFAAHADLLCTGYINRVAQGLDSNSHTISITGRGKTQDLVDCSADLPHNQLASQTVKQLAEALAKPHGIEVRGLSGVTIPQINVAWGESAFSVLERVCRFSALLLYEQADGSLLLTRVGTKKAAGEIAEGRNMLAANYDRNDEHRFAKTIVKRLSITPMMELGEEGNTVLAIPDPGARETRIRYVIAQAPAGQENEAGTLWSKLCASWRTNRDIGRSYALRVTVDSWRDGAGTLWQPNTLVRFRSPTLGLDVEWAVTQVTFTQDQSGTLASLSLMPPQALMPEPLLLQPLFADLPTAKP